MISEYRVKYFKKFKTETFQFNRSGVTLLAGDNNSGKSSIIQGLALWQFCVQEFQRRIAPNPVFAPAAAVPINLALVDFTPLSLPDLSYLWRGQRTNSKIELSCAWFLDPVQKKSRRRLAFAISRIPAGIEVAVRYSNLAAGDQIPRAAFLPAFAGIRAREMPLTESDRERLIGEGLAGAVLRNVLADMFISHKTGVSGLSGKARANFLKASPWVRLSEILQQVFGVGLRVSNGGGAALGVTVQEVSLGYKGRLKFTPKSRARDIMIEGSGFLQWLSVYTLAVRSDVDVLLLDEPDAHLHKQLQDELAFRMRNLVGNRSQVILATHSTELLSEADYASIYWLEKTKHGYLLDDDHRRRLFLGLGGLYAPKIEKLKRHKKLLMLEGPSDAGVLRALSLKLRGSWPDDVVEWHYKENDIGKSKYGRRALFSELREEIVNLKGLSLEDRDDKVHYKSISPDLAYAGKPKDGLALRMWRRRNLENYLLLPSAIARAIGKTEDEVSEFLVKRHGFGVVGNFKDADCHSSMALVDGKQILSTLADSVSLNFGTTVYAIAEAMEPAEIPDDIVLIINEIHSIWPSL